MSTQKADTQTKPNAGATSGTSNGKRRIVYLKEIPDGRHWRIKCPGHCACASKKM